MDFEQPAFDHKLLLSFRSWETKRPERNASSSPRWKLMISLCGWRINLSPFTLTDFQLKSEGSEGGRVCRQTKRERERGASGVWRELKSQWARMFGPVRYPRPSVLVLLTKGFKFLVKSCAHLPSHASSVISASWPTSFLKANSGAGFNGTHFLLFYFETCTNGYKLPKMVKMK